MSENANNSGKVVGIIIVAIVVIAGLGAVWYWGFYKPEQEAKEQARLEQIAKEEAEQKRKEEAARKKARYDRLIVDADTAFNQENWESARSLYAEASSLYPNEQYPQNQLTLVNAKLDEIAELEARKAAGIVERVSSPTGRFYVIVSSSIDDDLAMDYASKLAKEGTSVKLIEHNANELPFHGVSVGDYDTWDQATSASQTISGYENGAWVLKY